MKVYRSSMEKILDQMENDTIITNSREPVMTLFRKIGFVLARRADRVRRLFTDTDSKPHTRKKRR